MPPAAVFDYARVDTHRLSPREARAVKSKIGVGAHFFYEKTKLLGHIRLPP